MLSQHRYDTLSQVISPTDVEDFCENSLEKCPLLISRQDPAHFKKLIGLETIDAFFDSIKFRTAECFCVNGNSPIDVSEFSTRSVVDSRKALRLFGAGSTVILNRVNTYHDPLREFCADLSQELSAPVQANVYLTPPDAQGFKAHFDTHDVFILQVHGSKVWRVYDNSFDLPLAGQGNSLNESDLPKPFIERELKQGDTLYIPRGWSHDAVTGSTVSLHVTVGVFFFTWADLVLEATSHRILNDVKYRKSLPLGLFRQTDEESISDHFKNLLSELAMEQDIGPALRSLNAQLVEQCHQGTRGLLTQLEACHHLNRSSKVKAHPKFAGQMVTTGSDVQLTVPFGTLTIDRKFEGIVAGCLVKEPIVLSDVIKTDDPESIRVVQRLIRYEVLEIV